MANYNKIEIIGRIGQEPKYNESASGVAVARFSVATSEKVNDKEITQWHNVVCFKGTANFVNNYVHKGSEVFVEGKMTYPTYKNKAGEDVRGAEIVAHNIQLLSSAKPQQQPQQPAMPNDDDFPYFS